MNVIIDMMHACFSKNDACMKERQYMREQCDSVKLYKKANKTVLRSD